MITIDASSAAFKDTIMARSSLRWAESRVRSRVVHVVIIQR